MKSNLFRTSLFLVILVAISNCQPNQGGNITGLEDIWTPSTEIMAELLPTRINDETWNTLVVDPSTN